MDTNDNLYARHLFLNARLFCWNVDCVYGHPSTLVDIFTYVDLITSLEAQIWNRHSLAVMAKARPWKRKGESKWKEMKGREVANELIWKIKRKNESFLILCQTFCIFSAAIKRNNFWEKNLKSIFCKLMNKFLFTVISAALAFWNKHWPDLDAHFSTVSYDL